MKKVAAIVAIGAAAFVIGCSDKEAEQAREDAKVAAQACLVEYDDVVDAMSDLDSQTLVGLSFNEHEEAVTELSSEANSVDEIAVGKACNDLVTSIVDDTVDLYVEVNSLWRDCLESYYNCPDNKWYPTADDNWTEAAELTDEVKANLGIIREISTGERDADDYEVNGAPVDSSVS